MMRKLLVVVLVIGMVSTASAVPVFQIAPEDVKDHYAPSEWITINLVDDGAVIGMAIDAIMDGGMGGTVDNEVFASGWDTAFAGTLNSGGMLIEFMGASQSPPISPISGILYSFEYHVPNVQASTVIEITTFNDGGNMYFEPEISYDGASSYIGDIGMGDGPFIHIGVIPEPATIALLGLGGLLLRRHKK